MNCLGPIFFELSCARVEGFASGIKIIDQKEFFFASGVKKAFEGGIKIPPPVSLFQSALRASTPDFFEGI